MNCRVYAQGKHKDGSSFLYEFETKRDARTWAAQNAVVVRRIWAVYSTERPQSSPMSVERL